ncbi:MAG TPA: xylose isomerase, partial [Gammaproteobacteria bacterium]|nr:xylose isomerase [Gammaproteobacteria bacterium]
WDTDQFPNNVLDTALAYYQILRGGGFTTGGTNFDAKLRRQSLEPRDLLIGHVGGMDTCARALLAAAKMLEDGALEAPLEERYAAWNTGDAKKLLAGDYSLEDIERRVRSAPNPEPRSGKQELLENIVNRYV